MDLISPQYSMTETSSKHQLEHYISARAGVTAKEAASCLKALREYLLYKLFRREPLTLLGLGTFSRVKNSVKFKCGAHFLEKLRKTKEYQVEIEVAHLKRSLLNEPLFSVLEDVSTGVAALTEHTYLHQHLIKYLHLDYPHARNWKHPYTGAIYTKAYVEETVKLLRALNPHRYKLLLAIWVSIYARKRLLEAWDLDVEQYWTEVSKSLNSLLVLLELPDLSEVEKALLLELED